MRARGLAVFLMVFFGSMALGSVVWGQVATATSVQIALITAAAGLALGILVTRRFKVGQAENADLNPAALWPEAPSLPEGQTADRRAMVTVEYQVQAEQTSAFLETLFAFSKERMRDGATQWFVHESVETPGLWLESFMLPSWSEHLEQHRRVTKDDADLQKRLEGFDTREDGPVVHHYVAPNDP